MSPFVLAFAFFFGSLAGCSDGATANIDGEDREDAATPADATDDATAADAAVDSTAEPTDSTVDAAVDTRPDTGKPVDTGVGESGGTLFPCGGATCSSSFQYCRRATSPGICPIIDSGVCPAGCPGCPALATSCETLPSKCWAKPSCACILTEQCGSVVGGDCVEKDGGFTAGCRGA